MNQQDIDAFSNSQRWHVFNVLDLPLHSRAEPSLLNFISIPFKAFDGQTWEYIYFSSMHESSI